LRKSAFKYKLRSLERYREWFPPANVEFEFKSYDRVYRTYVDRANRIRLHDWLRDHPEAKEGDYMVFIPLSGGREWLVELEKGPRSKQATLGAPPKKREPQSRGSIRFSHREIQEIVVNLAEHFGMFAEEELREGPYVYDVVWRRVRSGNPVKVFEVQVSGSLDSALAKLKHARDTWNADLFLIVTNARDAEKAEFLLSGSFHEIRNRLLVLRDTELYEILLYKTRHGEIEQRLLR